MLGKNPSWLSDAIFYEIYPQSFCDSNGDGIGDLPGITSKLDYIRSLGCNAIWIHPCFVSPFRDAGYDVADFCKIAPRYGTNADMKTLVKESHARGMKVCLDMVAGHTAVDHPWFQASATRGKNPYTNRYIWTDTWCADPDGLEIVRGMYDSGRDGHFVTNFFWGQPALNYGFAKINRSWQLPPTHPDCVATKNALIDAMRFWLEMGVDGYRVDMAASLIKHDDAKGTATQKLWQDIFGKLRKDFPEAVMISEWFKPECAVSAGFDIDFAHIVSSTPHGKMFRAEKNANVHYSPGDKPWCNFEGISYFDRKGQGDAKEFFDEFAGMRRKLRKKGLVGWLTANHDIARISVNRSMKEIELVFAFVLTMPGVPFIYYGDEIGMKYLDLPSKEGGYTRTGSRTPMQWNGKKNAGFSSGSAKELYLPIDPDANRPTVEAQEKDPKSLLNTVRRLSELRHAMPALAGDADYAELFIKKHQYPIVYLRRRGKNRVLIAINPSGKPASAKFAVPGSVKGYATLAGSHVTLNKAGASFRLDLPATSYTIVDLG